MNKIVVANWKMNPQTLVEAEELFRASSSVIVCSPFIYLEELSKIKSGAILGAQDISLSDEPGQTGEISGEMLKQFGVKYVIVGHSDRRWKLGESDETVNKKIKLALSHGLTPIVCIGERSREGDFEDFLKKQTLATFSGLLASEEAQKCLVAYEPVWAISTTPGVKPDTPGSAMESIGVVKQALSSDLPFLYGGSVTSANVRDFLSLKEISGVLVGGASLDKEEFKKIIEIASHV